MEDAAAAAQKLLQERRQVSERERDGDEEGEGEEERDGEGEGENSDCACVHEHGPKGGACRDAHCLIVCICCHHSQHEETVAAAKRYWCMGLKGGRHIYFVSTKEVA